MARRIVVAKLGENTQWDATGGIIGTGITVSSNGKTASRAGAATNSTTRSVLPRTARRLFVVARVDNLGTGSAGLWFGLCTANAPNNVSAGAHPEQWALYSGTGVANTASRWNNGVNSVYASSPAFVVGSYLVAAYDLDLGYVWFGWLDTLSSIGVISWLNPGANPLTNTNPDYTNLLTAGTVKPSIKRKFHLLCNPYAGGGAQLSLVTDRETLRYVCPVGFTPYGEFAYIANEGYCSQSSDSPPDRYFAPRIAPDGDPTYTRGISIAQWSGGNTGTPLGNCTLLDPAGDLDSWSQYDLRDMAIQYLMGSPTAALSTFVVYGNAVIEKLEGENEQIKRIVHKDTLAQLDTPWQKNAYPSSVPNVYLEGKPLPVAFGFCTWVPLITADAAQLEYHVHDDEWGGVIELRDQGVAVTAGTGWDYGSRTDAVGVRRLTNPAGKQVASIRGQVTLGADVLAGNGTFTTWTSDNPNGFTVIETSPSLVTQTVAGTARFVRSTAVTLQLATSSGTTLTAGQLYYVTIQCVTWVSGSLLVREQGSGIILCTITKVGTYRFAFVASVTGDIGLRMASNGDLTVDNWFVYPATLVERITSIVPYIVRDRMGLDASMYDSTSLTTLDAAAPYKHGVYDADGKRGIDILRQVMRGYTGDLWVDRLNKIKVGRLTAPTITGGETTFSNIEIFGDIKVRPDLAPGLSDRLAGVPNFGPHTDSEIAGSVISAGSGQLAAQLKERYLAIKTGVGALSGAYETARGRPPVETVLSDATQVQAEATRIVGSLWNVPRVFIEFSAFVDGGNGYLLEPFQTHILNLERIVNQSTVADRYALQNHPVVLVQISSRPMSDLVDFVVWCALPMFLDPIAE